ncbi:MAG: TetR/AcrR family transcriptional regulator [Deltaproteobacteria bacterium]|jgi:AcrR family transcriptional regulator|nr:TetR/AcrR family transcriptional regulator [Deltaproteobacteria bacterium]
MRLVEEQKAERRERIVAAASELIAKGGMEALTMSRVADGARVTVPTVYNLVGNRDAVVTAVMDEAREGFLEKLAAVNADRNAEEIEIIVLVETFVKELVDRASLYQPLVQFGLQSGVDRSDAVVAALTPRLREAVVDLRGGGELADWVDVDFTTYRICALVLNAGWTWSLRQIGTQSLRQCVVYDVAAHLAGVCHGEARSRFEAVAARYQQAALSAGDQATIGRWVEGSGGPTAP